MKQIFILLLLTLSSCAVLHRTQISEIDSKAVLSGQRFEIKVSEMGFDLQQATDISKGLTTHQQTRDQMQQINDTISMFQMGPRTGKMVFNDTYPDAIIGQIRQKCPSGKVSSIISIRESAEYPVISGEIIKLVGYCLN